MNDAPPDLRAEVAELTALATALLEKAQRLESALTPVPVPAPKPVSSLPLPVGERVPAVNPRCVALDMALSGATRWETKKRLREFFDSDSEIDPLLVDAYGK